MPSANVRFYSTGRAPHAATLHKNNCDWVVRRKKHSPKTNGWWEYFDTLGDAKAAAEAHSQKQRGRILVQYDPICCRRVVD